ncbi:hypothetical protein DV738_g3261, partial [Chaetothyriales sp. CBS 135597]
MSTSTFEYGYIEDVEWLEDYRPGGYHPVKIDDRLNERYRVVHKLGYGTFSTAWLALDEQTSKYVAIKVGTAGADRSEVDVLSQLTARVAAGSGAADQTLKDAKMVASNRRLLQLDVARSLAAQLVMAISFVHSQGYAHGDKARFESYSPLILRPPEPVFEPTIPLSFAADIWTLGCIIFELFAQRSLIDGVLAPPSEIIAQEIHLQGPLPPEWWERYEDRFEWFDEAQNPTSNECDIWSWDRRFQQWIQEARRHYAMDVMDEQEGVALLDMLRWMLAWKPQDRPTADEILDAAWMKKWALPAYERAQKAWA